MLRTANEIYNLGQITPLLSLEGILHRSNLLNSDRFFSHYLEKSVIQKLFCVRSNWFEYPFLVLRAIVSTCFKPPSGDLAEKWRAWLWQRAEGEREGTA